MGSPTDIGNSPQGPDADGSFRAFADRLASGEGDAATELLSRYSARLVALPRRKMSVRLATKTDPEDVVQSVLRTFFRRLGEGEVELRDWSSLSGLLSLLTVRKVAMRGRSFSTAGRDVAREVPLTDADGAGPAIPDREPTPDEVVAFVDLVEHLLAGLPDRDRKVIEGLLAGESIPELAARLGRTERTIYRTLERVRKRLLADPPDPGIG